MKKRIGFIGVFLMTFLLHHTGFAQAEMADTMRSEGKIYVVVGIILLVLAGLIVYLFTMDKKIKNLEKRVNEKRSQTK